MKMLLFLSVAIAALNSEAKTWKVKTDNSKVETVFSLENGTVFKNRKITCKVIDAESSDENTERKIMVCSGQEISTAKVSLCVSGDDDTAYIFNSLAKNQPLLISSGDKNYQIFLYCED